MVEIAKEYTGDLFRSVVIDGNNALTLRSEMVDGKKKFHFSLERLINTISKVEELGWPTKTVMKEATYIFCLKSDSTLTEPQRKVLEQMERMNTIHLIRKSPDKDLDDKVMIQHALDHDAWILTGDTFRKDHLPSLLEQGKPEVINEINKRRIHLEFGPDHQPIFSLPENMAAMTATKVVSDTQNVDFELLSGGCPLWMCVSDSERIEITVPMRKPVGRINFQKPSSDVGRKEAVGAVSRSHFRIDWDGTNFYITDINSTNGTKIDGLKIPPHMPYPIESENIVTIGDIQFGLG